LQGAINQSGPVWFLASTFAPTPPIPTRSLTIPAGTAIFFPLIDYLDDYPCPYTTYPPGSKESLEDFLIDDAAKTINQTNQLPLSPGKHTLHFRGALPGFLTEVTYHLTISRPDGD
jgi:hypothetical protein